MYSVFASTLVFRACFWASSRNPVWSFHVLSQRRKKRRVIPRPQKCPPKNRPVCQNRAPQKRTAPQEVSPKNTDTRVKTGHLKNEPPPRGVPQKQRPVSKQGTPKTTRPAEVPPKTTDPVTGHLKNEHETSAKEKVQNERNSAQKSANKRKSKTCYREWVPMGT